LLAAAFSVELVMVVPSLEDPEPPPHPAATTRRAPRTAPVDRTRERRCLPFFIRQASAATARSDRKRPAAADLAAAQTPSGSTVAVQAGQRRAATEICVVHSGHGRVFGEAPFSSWYFLYGTMTKK